MARARNLKPGFFTNDVLAECDPLARIFFEGLWCHADRAGRLEWRPKKLKAEILPYDACDVDLLLAQLTKRGFIIQYEIEGKPFLQVVNFDKHQNPHVQEKASTIPAPCEHQTNIVVVGPLTSSLIPSPLIPDSSSEAKASAPMAPAVRPLDLKKAFWETGRAFLEANGVPRQRTGGLLGKWRRDFGEPAVVEAMARAEAECPSEVVEFIEGCLRAQNGKRANPNGRQSPHDTLVAGFGRAVARVQAGGG